MKEITTETVFVVVLIIILSLLAPAYITRFALEPISKPLQEISESLKIIRENIKK